MTIPAERIARAERMESGTANPAPQDPGFTDWNSNGSDSSNAAEVSPA